MVITVLTPDPWGLLEPGIAGVPVVAFIGINIFFLGFLWLLTGLGLLNSKRWAWALLLIVSSISLLGAIYIAIGVAIGGP